MYEKLTETARRVMHLANREAQRFNHEYIGTEHLLLGIVAEGTGVAACVLRDRFRLELRMIRLEVEKIVQAGPGESITSRLPHTPLAKKVIDHANDEARTLGHDYLGSEHLLLGLVRESEGVAAQVLMNFGLRLQAVREEVLNILGHPETAMKVGPAPALPRPRLDIEHMPNYARLLAEEFDRLIARVQLDKEKLVASIDFEMAAYLRDMQEQLKKMRAELMVQWPRHS